MKVRTYLASIIMFTAVLLVVLSCSSDNAPTDPDIPPGGFDTIQAVPSVTTSMPAGYVEITGLPAGNDQIYGIARSAPSSSPSPAGSLAEAAKGDTAFTEIVVTDTGIFFIYPLSPDNPVGGGTVYVTFTDDSSFTTEPIELYIDSLPEAPGEFAACVEALDAILEQRLRLNGYTRSDLAAYGTGNDPLIRIPDLEIFDAVASPDNENSLLEMVAGRAPILSEGTINGVLSRRTQFNPPVYEYVTVAVRFRGEFFNIKRPQCIDD